MLTELTGQIERITYSNEENGFTVVRLKTFGQKELVTVVGSFLAPVPGVILKMNGEWINHARYGEQFKVINYKTEVPATVYGIKKYLGSGLIKGIGPVMAGRIVAEFAENALDVIENNIQKLRGVEGIGEKRIAMIQVAWEEQKEIRSVMLFLQTHGVGIGYATRIFREYGDDSIKVVTENPYRLATDVFGIGFITADNIAEKLGFAKDAVVRIEAGIIYLLYQLSDAGHVYYPCESLVEKSMEILQVKRDIVTKAISTVAMEKRIVIEDINDGIEDFIPNNKGVFLSRFYLCEIGIASNLRKLIFSAKGIRSIDADKAVVWVQEELSIRLAPKQVEAVKRSNISKVLVITGGPGTGKTTIINAIIKIYSRVTQKIMLTAPTGRAAKRMSETTGRKAKTIHRLLEYSFGEGGFKKNSENLLNCDLLIVDEASMMDTAIMHYLLRALPGEAVFILVGDVNQLPSIGPGKVLNDIIDSKKVPVVKLKEIFRQAKQSSIVVNAHRINMGKMPVFKHLEKNTDLFFMEEDDPQRSLEIITELVKTRLPAKFNLDPGRDIQVLTPMHKGVVGSGNLNEKLQEALNPGGVEIKRGNRVYRLNDKVMQIRNNYDKLVFNGDIGWIVKISPEDQTLLISFDGRDILYDFAQLDEIVLAYAVSVHKAQGSEYPAVVIPLLMQHYILLQRNLIYTAITRGKRLVVIVGTKKALAMGVRNNKIMHRYTFLKQRLM